MISLVRIAGCMPAGRAHRRAPARRAHIVGATLHYGWRVAIGQMFRYFSGRFDVLVLSLLAPLSTVGNYAIAQTVAEIVLIVPQSFGWVVLPMVAAGEAHRAAPALRLVGTLALLGVRGHRVARPGADPARLRRGVPPRARAVLHPAARHLDAGLRATSAGSCSSGKKRPGSASLLAGGAAVADARARSRR